LFRLIPSASGRTGAVGELQPLVYSQGFFSLQWAWQQFAGSYVLAIVAIFLLAELAIRRPQSRRDLIFFFGLTTFLLAAAQVRMTYYFGIAAALFSGFLASKAFDSGARIRSLIATAVLVAFLFWPNISTALDSADAHQGVPPDWREALEWIRASTPEPFPDQNYYYAPYRSPAPPGYSVMAWWDFGYWITSIARRVPVSNPTQANASDAASFYLAQSEGEARSILDAWHSRYLIADAELPMRNEDGKYFGYFTSFFEYDRSRRLDEYIVFALEGDRRRLLYRPAYYRSMAVHLFSFNGAAVEQPRGAALAFLSPPLNGRPHPELIELRRFASAQDALAAEPSCRNQGCLLVSDDPNISCVRLEALAGFEQIHSNRTVKIYGLR
jgi:asparagine N-glycosylation enzyme membrane subunit Stt3